MSNKYPNQSLAQKQAHIAEARAHHTFASDRKAEAKVRQAASKGPNAQDLANRAKRKGL